jgi:hypothetical protein
MRIPTSIEAASLCRPSHMRAAVRGLCRRSGAVHAYDVHLAAAMGWLSAAASACGDRGVSYGYDLTRGFLPPYPETTGYIIPTFYEYADRTRDRSWSRRAGRLADWEIEVQMPSGAVQGGVLRAGTTPRPAVFNTGQVIFGWVEAHRRTGERRYLDAAERAGAWLVAGMDDDGCWRRDLSDRATTREQAYNARTAWALALVGQAAG